VPAFRRLLSEQPVFRHPLFRAWIVAPHALVEGVLRDPRFSVDRVTAALARGFDPFPGVRPDLVELVRNNLLMLDPPDHTRVRGLVNRAFTPRVVERLAPRIQRVVDEQLDALAASPSVDLIRDFAHPLPATIIAELLGVPAADHPRFRRWADDLSALLDLVSSPVSIAQLEATFGEVREYFEALFAERRRAPREDLVSQLVAAEAAGDRLSAAELLSVTVLLLGAGHETTTNLIGNAVLTLLRHPGERKRFQDDASLAESAVEEFLRFESPVQMTDRVAREELELGGRRVRAGETVALVLGAANRDPAVFAHPDRLDLARAPNRHLAFGSGVHFCPGAALARAEARLALASLLRRFPELRGDPDPPARDWKPSMVLRGLRRLPVELRG
jgi:cytochrome P450